WRHPDDVGVGVRDGNFLVDEIGGKRLSSARRGDVDNRTDTCHRQRLFDGADLEADIHACGKSDANLEVITTQCLETSQFVTDGVDAGRQIRERVETAGV